MMMKKRESCTPK
uniref:Uncharacterized protein n=1 Tax=Arundo donax TaxID=35708 RepID=A0A0A9APK0_ARUDO